MKRLPIRSVFCKNTIFAISALILTLTLITNTACQSSTNWNMFRKTPINTENTSARQQLKLLMPSQLEILPFTKPRSWGNDYIPDGIEVVLRPLDSFGDQTKAVGTFRFELYQFRKAHADPRGQRIALWQVNLTSKKDQKLHWDKITRTYTFRLGWTKNMPPFKPGKYVLQVTYISPWNERISATYIFTATLPKQQIKKQIERKHKNPFGIFK